jgi:hypothetical protein
MRQFIADRVVDLNLSLDESGVVVKVANRSTISLNSRKFASAASDVSNDRIGKLPCRVLHNADITNKKFVAVFHHIHCVYRCRAATVDSVTEPAIPLLNELKPVDDGCIIRERGANLKNPHHVVGHVPYIDSELLGKFAVFSRSLKGNVLFLLS